MINGVGYHVTFQPSCLFAIDPIIPISHPVAMVHEPRH